MNIGTELPTKIRFYPGFRSPPNIDWCGTGWLGQASSCIRSAEEGYGSVTVMGPCFVLNTIALANIGHGESVSSRSKHGQQRLSEYRPRHQSLSSQFGLSFGLYHVCRSHYELPCWNLPTLSICPSRTSYEASTGDRGWSTIIEVYRREKRGKRSPAEYQARYSSPRAVSAGRQE